MQVLGKFSHREGTTAILARARNPGMRSVESKPGPQMLRDHSVDDRPAASSSVSQHVFADEIERDFGSGLCDGNCGIDPLQDAFPGFEPTDVADRAIAPDLVLTIKLRQADAGIGDDVDRVR